MKRILVLLILFSSFLFFGCNNQQNKIEDNEITSTDSGITNIDSVIVITPNYMEMVSDTSK